MKANLDQFDIYYREYKEYTLFFDKMQKEAEEQMLAGVKDILADESDNDKAAEFIIKYKTLPLLHAKDLDLHKERLLIAYEFCKGLEGIPDEVHEELKTLKTKQSKLLFHVKHGEAIPVAPDLIAAFKNQITPQKVSAIIQNFKNITELGKQ